MKQGTDQCLYRGPDGTRCAIGWLIPEDKYSPDIEGKFIGLIDRHRVGVFPDISYLSDEGILLGRFLNSLQNCHDETSGRGAGKGKAAMKMRLKSFAEQHNLKIPRIKKVS